MSNQEVTGRLPSASGHSAEPEPVPVSPLRASVPSAEGLLLWRNPAPDAAVGAGAGTTVRMTIQGGVRYGENVASAWLDRGDDTAIFPKPFPAVPILAAAIECSDTAAVAGLRALAAAGYVIAPREPTNAMLAAYLLTYVKPTNPDSVMRAIAKARRRWKVMAESGNAMAISRRFITPEARAAATKIASAIEAASAGETDTGSTVGESAVPEPDPQLSSEPTP